MEAELDDELAAFDRLLLREQERLAENRPQGASASGPNGGGGFDGSGVGSGAGGASGSPSDASSPSTRGGESRRGESSGRGDESGQESQAESGGSVGGGGTEGGRSDRVPSDIPSGEDDDIVARQLREAAENEPDPELRARLWDEYRAYKSGRRATRTGEEAKGEEEN